MSFHNALIYWQEREIEHLRWLLAQWEKNCTGMHGSQNPCGLTAEHTLPTKRTPDETTTGGVDAFTWELAKKQLGRLVGLEEECARYRAAVHKIAEVGTQLPHAARFNATKIARETLAPSPEEPSEPPLPAGWVEHSRHGEYVEGRRGNESAMFHLHMLHRPPTVHYCTWVGRDVQCDACGNGTRLPEKASGELPLCDCDPDFGCKEYDPAIFRCCQQEMERRAAQENGSEAHNKGE